MDDILFQCNHCDHASSFSSPEMFVGREVFVAPVCGASAAWIVGKRCGCRRNWTENEHVQVSEISWMVVYCLEAVEKVVLCCYSRDG